MDGTNTENLETTNQSVEVTEGSEWDDFFDDDPEEETVGTEETGADDEGAGTQSGGGDPEVSNDSAAEGAAGGFTAEQQAAIQAEAARQVDAMVAQQYGHMRNPYTGNFVTTKAELDAYNRAYQEEERRIRLQEQGIDQNVLNDAVNNSPAMRQAQQIIQEHQQTEALSFLNNEFAALKKEYPDCGFADAREMYDSPEGKAVMELFRDNPGLSMADAYMILNKDKIRTQQNAAVKQGVLNQMNGTKHLRQTRSGMTKADIPTEIYDEYKVFFPDATHEEIEKMYLKNHTK